MIDKIMLAKYLFENKLEYFQNHVQNNCIRKGENPFTREYDGGRAPLLVSAVARGQLEFVKIMVENGANVNFVDKTYFGDSERVRPILQIAIENEQEEIAKYLIAKGAKVESIKLEDSFNKDKLELFLKKHNIEKLHTTLDEKLPTNCNSEPIRKKLKI